MADDLTLPPRYSEAVRLLYSADPGDFVNGRTELARLAVESGDRGVAAQIKKLRRPTRGGWLLNLLAAEDAEMVQRVRRLGSELADAHRDSDAAALRRLSTERGALLAASSRRLSELATSRDWTPTPTVLAEATETLQAALADPDLGERIAAGAMVTTVRAAGFGPVDLFAPLAPVIPLRPRPEVGAPRPPGGRKPVVDGRAAELRQAQQKLDAAELRLEEARQDAERAEQARVQAYAEAEQASVRAGELAARIESLTRQLADARAGAAEQDRRSDRLSVAARNREVAAGKADRELAECRREIQDLRADLERKRQIGVEERE